MNIMAFNGSPRNDWNTATLLNKVLEGAASKGATTAKHGEIEPPARRFRANRAL